MQQSIDDLIKRIKELQEELEVEYKKKRDEFEFSIEKSGSVLPRRWHGSNAA